MSVPAARAAIFAALLLPACCKLLLVEIEDDGGGDDVATLGSAGASQRGKRTMKGAESILLYNHICLELSKRIS